MKSVETSGKPAENGTAKEDADQSQSASGEGNKETEGKDAAASESEGADSGAVVSEDIGMPILELDTVEAEEGQAQDTSGDEEPAQTQQDEENETSMMTDF